MVSLRMNVSLNASKNSPRMISRQVSWSVLGKCLYSEIDLSIFHSMLFRVRKVSDVDTDQRKHQAWSSSEEDKFILSHSPCLLFCTDNVPARILVRIDHDCCEMCALSVFSELVVQYREHIPNSDLPDWVTRRPGEAVFSILSVLFACLFLCWLATDESETANDFLSMGLK